jgi:hypothetical protein
VSAINEPLPVKGPTTQTESGAHENKEARNHNLLIPRKLHDRLSKPHGHLPGGTSHPPQWSDQLTQRHHQFPEINDGQPTAQVGEHATHLKVERFALSRNPCEKTLTTPPMSCQEDASTELTKLMNKPKFVKSLETLR